MACIGSEINILQSLDHRNIVQFFDITDRLMTYVNMESAAGEDLSKGGGQTDIPTGFVSSALSPPKTHCTS